MGFKQFWEDCKPITFASEIQLHHKDIPFCGTADFIGIIADKKTNKNDITLVDYKTGNPFKVHQVQLSAYAMIWNKLFPKYKVEKIATLHLKDTWIKKPTYTLKYYNIDYTLVKMYMMYGNGTMKMLRAMRLSLVLVESFQVSLV